VYQFYQHKQDYLYVEKNYLYWAEWILGIVDVTNPENPTQLTTFTGKDRGRGVSAENDKIFFADQTQGVWILRNNLITNIKDDTPIVYDYELSQNFPNPFNPITTIEFAIPDREKIKIEVYDLLGRKIETLIDNEIEAGKHQISFNATGLASGIYFYRLITSITTFTKKMMILK
jgi:hypothetical protein